MKVKLLKKARKRFVIYHYPEGEYEHNGQFRKGNFFTLFDKTNEYYYIRASVTNAKVKSGSEFETEKECINYLKQRIIFILKSEGHQTKKMRDSNSKIKKAWYL